MDPNSSTLSETNYPLLLPVGATIRGFVIESKPFMTGDNKRTQTCVRVTHSDCGHAFDASCAWLIHDRVKCPNCQKEDAPSSVKWTELIGKTLGRYTVVNVETQSVGSNITLRCIHCGITGKRRSTEISTISKSKKRPRFDIDACKRCELIDAGILVLPPKAEKPISELDTLLLEIREPEDQPASYVEMLEA